MSDQTTSVNTNETPRSQVDANLRPTAEMHVLVGGPYTLNGELHRYGHTALRIKTPTVDLTYDFGRYGRTTGDFGAEGEGILRVWSSFSPYIMGENALGRVTTAYVYAIFEHQATAIINYYSRVIEAGTVRRDLERGRSTLKVYQLQQNYHALGYNCTTLSLDGAKVAYGNFEDGSQAFIKPDAVLTFAERMAMRTIGGGTPNRIFLPANLDDFLTKKPAIPPTRVVRHGG